MLVGLLLRGCPHFAQSLQVGADQWEVASLDGWHVLGTSPIVDGVDARCYRLRLVLYAAREVARIEAATVELEAALTTERRLDEFAVEFALYLTE